MHLLKDKKYKFIFYSFLVLFLTSTNNYNFISVNIFSVKHIYVSGLSDDKNKKINNQIKNINGKNIFFLKKDYFTKLVNRNDIKYLSIKKNYPNVLILDFIPAKPICIIEIEDSKIILGDNGKKLDTKIKSNSLPIVLGSDNFSEVFHVINLLKSSKFEYKKVEKIIFFKSGRFDINLNNSVIIKFPIKYTKEIINYSHNLLNRKKFANSKIIDLRIKNKIIKYE
ncbi:cell division protein FtsQ/DivIB [Candidatus Pelagibacter communis]|uniref:cell division protein FtsQ/DivIB n=1 Tax=Pelagibacter ubique TaxID=198252 RepID=UPI00094C5DDA|nr:hypothetical protein [Candidatus Pelagibacter ubique]